MDTRQRRRLKEMWGQHIIFDYPLGRHTTLGVGGSVEALYEALEIDQLSNLVRFLHKEKIPYLVVGKGSNMLVLDRGVEGVAIRLGGPLACVEVADQEGGILRAGAGAPLSRLLDFCRSRGLGGFEFLAGIPGTVGGAVVMNAGAFGHEVAESVIKLGIVTPMGRYRILEREELDYHYRGLGLAPGSVVVEAWLAFQDREPPEISRIMKKYLAKRRTTQPLGLPSAGSIFKNPPGHFAGQLIEAAGLKGRAEGRAVISEKHANFILNRGGALARDVVSLIELARQEVRKRFGVELECEVKVVGKGE